MYNIPHAERARQERVAALLREMTLAKRPSRKTLNGWCGGVKELGAMLEKAHREIINLKLDGCR